MGRNRFYVLFLAISLGAFAVSTGFLVNELLHKKDQVLMSVPELITQFEKSHEAVRTLDIGEDYPSAQDRVLLDPNELMARTFAFPYAQLSKIYKYSISCTNPPRTEFQDAALKKAFLWARFVCGEVESLPEKFFKSRPWIHPLGESYVERAFKLDDKARARLPPLEGLVKYMHILELSRPGLSVSKTAEFLRTLALDAMDAVVQGRELVLEGPWLLIKSYVNRYSNESNYQAYRSEQWHDYVASFGFKTTPDGASGDCERKMASLCWTPVRKATQDSKTLLWVGSSLFLALSIVAAVIWLRALRRDRLVAEKQQFAFLMMAHELRLPVATLMLEMESLRERPHSSDEDTQDSVLRASNAVERLRRISEISTKYLKSGSSSLVEIRTEKISSLNDFIAGQLESLSSEIDWCPLDRDVEVELDPYWFSFCLHNLVSNSLKHGRPPVSVRFEQRSRSLNLVIEDRGELRKSSMSADRGGLGIGLSLVQRVTSDLGYKLKVSAQPTTFTIQMGQV